MSKRRAKTVPEVDVKLAPKNKKKKVGAQKEVESEKQKRAAKSEAFAWGQAGLYTQFLELCATELDKGRGNVFDNGKARKNVAHVISQSWPGCTAETVRSKLRQPSVITDLEEKGVKKRVSSFVIS